MTVQVHLLSGLPTSGKTTFASTFKGASDTVIFSLDYWLFTLYGKYDLTEVSSLSHKERVLRSREVIFTVAQELVRRNLSVVLDDGFFTQKGRALAIEAFQKVKAEVVVHYFKIPLVTLQKRLIKRNAKNLPYTFLLTPDQLGEMAEAFEVPTPEEFTGTKVRLVIHSFSNEEEE